MSSRRNWYFSTVAVAALSLGLDAAAEKPSFGMPKFPDFKPGWASPGKGPSPLMDRGNPAGRGPQFDRGAPDRPAAGNRSESSGPSAGNSSSGHDGNGWDKSNKGGNGHGSSAGKDKHDAPDESLQANAGDVILQARPLRTMPTCR